jgi:limonene-1,2-epoxide hydrolase
MFHAPKRKEPRMNTGQIANRLAELCRQGQFETAQKELFADNAVSIEPRASADFAKETRGLSAIIEKGHKFDSMVEHLHGCSTSAPLVAGNAIAFTLTLDVTMKGRGRVKMEEICTYEVQDGKIVSEQFFM